MINLRYTGTFEKWLKGLKDARARGFINLRLNRIKDGNLGDVKPVGFGVSEMRIHYGAGYRIYFYQYGSEVIILLCGGDKSSQKADIERAKEMKECLTKQLLN